MKFIRIVLLPLLLLAAGCTSEEEAARVPTPPTVKPGRIIACTNTAYVPFEFLQDGQMTGIDPDLLRAMAELMDLQVEFRPVAFENAFAELEARNCDLLAAGITPERQAKYAFSDGYFEVSPSLLVRSADRERFTSLAAFGPSRIGAQGGTTGSAYVKNKVPGVTVVERDASTALIAMLKAGQIDGLVQDSPLNQYAVRQDPALAVAATFNDVERERYGFVMNKDAEQLRVAINEALGRIRTNGQYDEILARYLGAG